MTALLIMANMLVFGLQIADLHVTLAGALVPHDVTKNCWTLLTHCFLHGGLAHLLGNMWFLWTFGDNVEDHMGSWNFLFFYLCCGLLSGLAECIFYPRLAQSFIGASGAISGVMAAYFLLFPRAKVRVYITLWFRAWLPAWFLLGSWFALQLLGQATDSSMTAGVSFIGHIGGFVAGFLLCLVFFREETA